MVGYNFKKNSNQKATTSPKWTLLTSMSGSNFSTVLILLNTHSKVPNAMQMYTSKISTNLITNKVKINLYSSINLLVHVKT